MRLVAAIILGMCALSARSSARAACDPSVDPDKSDVANAREAVTANCNCSTATSHGAYARCAAGQANALLANASCASAVKKCAAKSTCGRPGFVTCCRTNRRGKTTCSTKREATRCVAPRGGTACVGTFASCCDACTAGGCATTTSTTATTTTSTTLYSCAGSDLFECNGTCPPDALCGPDELLVSCRCISSAEPCGGTAPFCNGTCPSGEECATFQHYPLPTCGCIPTGVPACGNPGVPVCGGACPSGLECHAVFEPPIAGNVVICQCTAPGPCGEDPVPTSGACPKGSACTYVGGFFCAPIPCTPDNPYPTCGGQCGDGGECQPFSFGTQLQTCACTPP